MSKANSIDVYKKLADDCRRDLRKFHPDAPEYIIVEKNLRMAENWIKFLKREEEVKAQRQETAL